MIKEINHFFYQKRDITYYGIYVFFLIESLEEQNDHLTHFTKDVTDSMI